MIADSQIKPVNILSLFDGYGSGMLALRKLRVPVGNYWGSEIEPNAIKVTSRAFPEMTHLGSVEEWRDWDIDWKTVDLILAGSPCTGFSLQGKLLNFNDPQSKLFFVFEEILNHIKLCNPNVKFLLENTRMKAWCLDEITARVGVNPVCLDSSKIGYGLRTRNYWANWCIPQLEDLGLNPQDIIEQSGFPATVKKGKSIPGQQTSRLVVKTSKFMCLTASYAKGIRSDGRPMVARATGEFDSIKHLCRMLTVTEAERLMGVPVGHTDGIPKTLAYKMLGNGWHVPTIVHILGHAGLPRLPLRNRS